MATMLAYVTGQLRRSRRGPILEEFRTSKRILTLFQQGLGEMEGASWLKENGSCASSAITEDSPPPKSVTHRVQRGDTLAAIARHYGTTVGAIQGANGMGRSTRIGIGERLQISGSSIIPVDSHSPSKPFAVAIGKLLAPECYLEEPLA